MKFGEIFWGEMKIDTLKGGGDASKWLLQMKNKYPNVQLHYLPDLLF